MRIYELDCSSSTKPLEHYWELCVGSCHGTTALREDYRKQLEKCHKELGFKYVRFHGLFDDDMSVLTGKNALMQRERSDQEFTLSFTNIDSIFDFLLSIGMKPFIELGFMPKALTSGTCTIFHYEGHTSPPDDYGKWQWFIEQFASHCVERYGLDEVRQWFFEVWNEPNLGGRKAHMGFWGGSQEDYFKLYEAAARGVKAVDHLLRVGGPATAMNAWVPELIQYCRDRDVPLDFITTHHYPGDAAYGDDGANIFSFSGEDTPERRAEMMKAFMMSEEQKWQKVPRGVVTKWTKKVREEAGNLPVYYTEWNSGAGIQSDGPFGASFIAKTCLDNHGLVQGYSYWTFTDIFEEGGMPHTPFHGGFGLLNLQGIPKATYRAFQLLHKLGSELYNHKYSEGTLDIYSVKKPESGCVQILVVNHQSLHQEIAPEEVEIRVDNLPGFVKATVERVDNEHGNALRRWRELGEPDYPSDAIIYDLMASSYTKAEPVAANYDGSSARLSLTVPEQGIALVTIYY